jgi:hypothetical protein
MNSALDYIKTALRRCNAYQSGETIAPQDALDCLEVFNDLLDAWSTDELYVFGSNENILQWNAGQNQYTIGNPTCADLGNLPFSGTLTGASAIITGVTNIPADLVIGSTVTDSANVLPAGTTVTAIGATTVTLSAAATITPSANPVQITYTIPGDFAIARPLRITNAFTRFSSLDFTLDVMMSQARFTEILYKAQPGPWPVVAWYNAAMPYGILNVFPTPASAGTLYLYTDTILSNLTIDQTLIVPQGYARALKWCLAKELCGEFGYPMTDSIRVNAAESLAMVRALNAVPAVQSRYDNALITNRRPGGDWILTGGY